MTVMRLQDNVTEIARSLLATTAKCQHCGGQAAIEYAEGGSVGLHVCPGRYVSRIIMYGNELDTDRFLGYVRGAARGTQGVEAGDVRVASRYAWDLGLARKSNDIVLKEMYWTQNYRRTKSEDPDRMALFFCANGDSFFVQPLKNGERLCDKCRTS
ncbi:MAG: hypothetical protein JRM88_04705 [Nitrososphaerota archaeon]|nr:hypothetical protein [Nitrososphaerota archaeon]